MNKKNSFFLYFWLCPKSVFRCRPPKTDFRFLIYTPKNIFKKKHGLQGENDRFFIPSHCSLIKKKKSQYGNYPSMTSCPFCDIIIHIDDSFASNGNPDLVWLLQGHWKCESVPKYYSKQRQNITRSSSKILLEAAPKYYSKQRQNITQSSAKLLLEAAPKYYSKQRQNTTRRSAKILLEAAPKYYSKQRQNITLSSTNILL